MTGKPSKWWWLPGAMFLLMDLAFWISAVRGNDDTGKWVLAIGFLFLGVAILYVTNVRRRAAQAHEVAASAHRDTERAG